MNIIEDLPGIARKLIHDVPQLSVVIPAYNEGAQVVPTVDRIRSVLLEAGIVHEIIIVDDGSKDDTFEHAQSTGANVIRMPQNGGYGRALKAGVAVSQAQFVAIIDADGTYPAEPLPEMLALARFNDMVTGHRGAAMENVPLARRPAKKMLNWIASKLAGHRITDLNSGLRVFRKEALTQYLHLLPNAFSFTTTITLCMLASGRPTAYIPITYGKRVGSSKIKPSDFLRFMALIVRMTAYFQPLRIFAPIALFLFVLGLGKAIYDIFLDNLSETAVFGMLGGIMVFSLGLIADMVSRLYFDPSRRARDTDG